MKVADPSRESCLNNISWHLTTSAFVFQLLISEGVELVLTGGGLERRDASHLLFLMSRSHGSSDALRVTSKRNIKRPIGFYEKIYKIEGAIVRLPFRLHF